MKKKNTKIRPVQKLTISKYSDGSMGFNFHHKSMTASDLLYIARIINSAISQAIAKQETNSKEG